jgi:uncharacterized Fe-S cluster protein YjdI
MSKVTWDEKVCEHAGVCVNGLPSVFRIEGGRFVIDESGAARQAIREVVATCPSGALKMED